MSDSQSTIFVLHNVSDRKLNKNYNTPDEVKTASGLLTFDGVYDNVWCNKSILAGKDFILFVMGKYVGDTNAFDRKMPLETLCDWDLIAQLASMGGHIGWHTWSHPDLTKLSAEELKKEVTPPFPMKYFAYPHGRFNERVIEAVKEAGFEYAFSVNKGDNSRFQKLRKYL